MNNGLGAIRKFDIPFINARSQYYLVDKKQVRVFGTITFFTILKMSSFYKISIVSLCALLTSCEDWSHGKFEITNDTSVELDSINILPDRAYGRHFISLKPDETKSYVTDMGGPGATDGAYHLQYKIKSTVKFQIFGYYSNGSSLEKRTKVIIMPDTVLFKFIN